MTRFLPALACFLFVLPASAEQPTPPERYPGAEVRELKVGETLDVTPEGIILQLICDEVDELIEVTIGDTQVLVKALAPGVTACSFYGQQDRDEGYEDQRSGVVEYRKVVKFIISA